MRWEGGKKVGTSDFCLELWSGGRERMGECEGKGRKRRRRRRRRRDDVVIFLWRACKVISIIVGGGGTAARLVSCMYASTYKTMRS